ncbi:MAG: hypothetical protein ACXWID_05305 [Pyrinomonadaceae bacterium]
MQKSKIPPRNPFRSRTCPAPSDRRTSPPSKRNNVITLILLLTFVTGTGLSTQVEHNAAAALQTKSTPRALQVNTLCAKTERVIFACVLRRPAKIVSVCASKDLTRDTGYVQYRFGSPAKIELEYPKDRTGTQQKFEYTHYMRALVDLNEINFSVDGVDYSVVDDYNGEEKPAQSIEGITINWPNTSKKEVRYTCRTKPKTDYTDLQAVLFDHN